MSSIQEKSVFAALPHVMRGKPVKLGGDPKGKNFLYCNGTSVFIRNLENPKEVDIYTNHAKPTTVARYSPSSFYIASCDQTGKVRIWDTVNKEHICKCEYPVLGGEIRDVAWSPDSQKLAVCGDGRGKVAHVINMDTGTSVGDLSGHSKMVNTISYRQCRPFRIATASEDQSNAFFEGPPFKFVKTQTMHTNFANVARFSPGGEVVLCGGADGKLFKCDGKDFSLQMQFGSDEKPVHRGGIYEISFNKEGTKALTASGDKTAKIFNVETGDIETTFDMSKSCEGSWENMQLGCLWQGDKIITVNGFGHIIYHDEEKADTPKKVIKGHMKPINALAVSEDKRTVFTCGIEGIMYWDVETGDCDNVKGKGHGTAVTDMVVDGNMLLSVGVDDTLRVSSVTDKVFSGAETKLKSQPVKIDSLRGTVVVACVNHVIVVDAGCDGQQRGDGGLRVSQTLNMDKDPMSVSISPDGVEVAVGFKENEIRIYSMGKGSFSETRKLVLSLGEVTCLAYSPCGAFLAYGCGRKVGLRSRNDYELVERESEKHTARVMSLAWSPNSKNFATGALDGNLATWSIDMDRSSGAMIRSNANSHINKLAWLDPNTIITAGHDSNVKQYTVSA